MIIKNPSKCTKKEIFKKTLILQSYFHTTKEQQYIINNMTIYQQYINNIHLKQHIIGIPSVVLAPATKRFPKKRFLILFLKAPLLKKFFILPEKSFSNFQETEPFLYFRKGVFKTLVQRNFSYISEKKYSEPWHNRTMFLPCHVRVSE